MTNDMIWVQKLDVGIKEQINTTSLKLNFYRKIKIDKDIRKVFVLS